MFYFSVAITLWICIWEKLHWKL